MLSVITKLSTLTALSNIPWITIVSHPSPMCLHLIAVYTFIDLELHLPMGNAATIVADQLGQGSSQSRKNMGSAVAMLPGKFWKSLKVQ